VKDLRIEKLDPKDMGQYHIRRKMDEVVEVLNEILKWMKERADQTQSSDTSTD